MELDDTITLKNGQTRYYHYHCRQYNRNQRIFPTALQIFRLGLGQPAVNFPALTARFLYEYFTEHIKDEDITVYVSYGFGLSLAVTIAVWTWHSSELTGTFCRSHVK